MSASPAAVSTRLAPTPLGVQPSFGFGDRLGLATPGHVAALREAGGAIRGIFAQQSIREMTRTRRDADTVMNAAVEALTASDFADPWSADADHLKTLADVRRTMDAGFVMFTLDPSDHVDQQADDDDAATLAAKFAAAREFAPWVDDYRGRTIRLDGGTVEFDDLTLARAAVKYGQALVEALELAKGVRAEAHLRRQPFELELSVDETAHPTTPAEHYIIADQFQQADVALVSLAPRFVGDFEKGVDFKGDLKQLEASMRLHAEIARRMGPYKLSLHSGSDKLSIYPILARVTQGMFHVKTAGTSYLEALRVAAQVDPRFFREIVSFSRERYDVDKASYHVSARLKDVPSPEDVSDALTLERRYLERWEEVAPGRGFTAPGRQILHCTFGSVLTDPRLGPQLVALLTAHSREHCEILRQHFARHLQALRAG
jgi:tagaturonate epimerase